MAATLRTVADGVQVGALGPGTFMNLVVLDGGVVVDSGLRLQRRRLQGLLRGVDVGTHVVTHAHADHLGSSAWLCDAFGVDLAMGHVDADLFERGRIDTVRSRMGRVVLRAAGSERRPVDRRLRDGDRVGEQDAWEVVEVPGHSPGTVAFWRAADRVLVVGDGPVNVGSRKKPRWFTLPRGLNDDLGAAAASRRRLVELDPALVVPVHGAVGVADDAWRRAMLGG